MNSATARIATTTALLICVGSLTLAAAEANQSRQTQSFPAQVQAAAKKSQKKSFEDFVTAIHQVETTGRTGIIYGDGRRSLGPLQISRAAWQDALNQDPTIRGTYADCKTLAYSVKIMRAYLLKHDPAAFNLGDWETCARLWNSGPTWYAKVRLTNKYWAQVRGHLLRSAQAAG